MSKEREAHNSSWQIVTINHPVVWARDEHENWLLNPPRRYVVNASQIKYLQPYVESISDLKSARKFKSLNAGVSLNGAKILVERNRDRGIGDMLFLTGPLNYLKHITGGTAKIYMYGLTERCQILNEHPCLENRTVMSGPIHYEDLDLFDRHWFIESVTEYDEEPDQDNVYDALYKQIGLDPAAIDPRWKRPTAHVSEQDYKNLDSLYFYVWGERKVDLRKEPYYVVAPFSHGTLRCASYSNWLNIIGTLAERRPVIVIGHILEGRMPSNDMSFGAFYQEIGAMAASNRNVINLIGNTPVRLMMALIENAKALVGLDSAPLYIAQALRTPAVSLWGSHHPGSRLGYDASYLSNAIWNHNACPSAPCYAYHGFPASKCPNGVQQNVCSVLQSVDPKQILEKISAIDE